MKSFVQHEGRVFLILSLISANTVASVRPMSAEHVEAAVRLSVSRHLPEGAQVIVRNLQFPAPISAHARCSLVTPQPPLGLVTAEFVDSTGGRVTRNFARAEVTALLPIAIVRTDLRSEEALTKERVAYEPRELTPLAHRGFFTEKSLLQGLVARGYLRAGTVLTQAHVQAPQIVKFGESVNLTLRRGSVLLNVRVRALENGRLDDKIRVENATSRKILVAKIVSPGELEIN